MAGTSQAVSSVRRLRENLRASPTCRIISPEEFVRLAVSTMPLVRSDEPGAHMKGLMDKKTGTRFLAEEEKLFPDPIGPGS